jgi:myo-inositol-1(or 4)-monophosphatase
MGIVDCYYQKGIHIWDIIAGSLIVKEAGGVVSTFSGDPNFLFSSEVLATNGVLHTKMVEFLKG